MAFVTVVLQANRQAMPQDRFLTMGHGVIWEEWEMRGKFHARTTDEWDLVLRIPSPRSSLPFYVFPYSQRNVQRTAFTN